MSIGGTRVAPRFLLAIIIGICLNVSGAVVSKFLALNLENLIWAVMLAGMLGIVYVARIKYWVVVSRLFQLSYIYPLLSVTYLVSFVLGIYVFNESFDWSKLLGSAVIVAGVVVVSTSESKTDKK